MNTYSVIKNDGPAGALFWKHGCEDFRTGSQLIVAENEEALFEKEGVIVQTFSGGRFTLKTGNYPFIDRLRSMFSGNRTAFRCRVFFVNKADALDLKWGTDSPIQVLDPVMGVATHVQGRGSYSVRVRDAKKFVLKFVANNTQGVGGSAIPAMFRSAFLQTIKSCVARGIRESGREILGIVEELASFAAKLAPMLSPVMEEYGLELVNFYVDALDIPADDPSYADLNALRKQKAGFKVLGNDWQRVQGLNVLMSAANNQGAAGMGAGLGIGMAAGGAMGAAAASVFAPSAFPAPSAPPAPAAGGGACPACRAPVAAGAKFCPACGAKLAPAKAFCANCGAELPSGSKFCPECGAKQS